MVAEAVVGMPGLGMSSDVIPIKKRRRGISASPALAASLEGPSPVAPVPLARPAVVTDLPAASCVCREVPLSDIVLSPGVQQRTKGLDPQLVADYADGIADWLPSAPLAVFFQAADASALVLGVDLYWLADGFHRFEAARQVSLTSVPCVVRLGTRRDAVLFACGANSAHGLRRTNEDKRRAVTTLLNDPEWSQWSDRQIAEKAGVSNKTVSTIRAELCNLHSSLQNVFPLDPDDSPTVQGTSRLGADGRLRPAPAPRVPPAPPVDSDPAPGRGRVRSGVPLPPDAPVSGPAPTVAPPSATRRVEFSAIQFGLLGDLSRWVTKVEVGVQAGLSVDEVVSALQGVVRAAGVLMGSIRDGIDNEGMQ